MLVQEAAPRAGKLLTMLLGEKGAATQEIARNVEQAANGTTEVSSNISGVQQAAGETGSSASDMLGAATELSQQSELLRSEVDKFLDNVRNS